MELLPSRCYRKSLLLLLLALDQAWGQVRSAPGLPSSAINIPGDLLIGALVTVTGYEDTLWNGRCQDTDQPALAYIEANQLLIELTDAVNANSSILNGIKLGLTDYDFCVRDMFALAQSLHFLPALQSNNQRYIAVICCDTSSVTVTVSPLMTAYEMPIISWFASSDDLSNKLVHEYFLRTVPANHFDVEMVVSVLQRYKWPYISVLYLDGNYGTSMMNMLKQAIEELPFTICIGYSYMYIQSSTEDASPEIVDHLLNETDLTVVVLLVYDTQALPLFRELQRRNIKDRFIWIGTSGWSTNLDIASPDLRPYGGGLITSMSLPERFSDEYKFLRDPAFAADPRNPRIITYWETRLNCKWNVTCNESTVVANKPKAIGEDWQAQIYDAFMVLVKGLQSYLPRIDYNISRFSSNDYLWTMKSLHFQGKTGTVQFDANGDLLSNMDIRQGIRVGDEYKVVTIGYWSAADKQLHVNESKIWWYGRQEAPMPTSICSRECKTGYIAIPRVLVCCWFCFRCRNNEITNANASVCIECPTFTWPDETRLHCNPITPTFVHSTDDLGIALLVLASVCLLVVLAVIVIFIRNNENRLIRSSCRESSYIMLVGIAINFMLLILLVGYPSDKICLTFRYGLHLSCTMIYGPIMIKISKIFRIFMAGRKSTQAPKFIEPSKQVAVIVALIVVETLVVTGSIYLHFPSAERFMASPIDPVVEMTCSESFGTMGVGLAFNIVLILGCAVLAFVSRKLPDNYNESSQVAFSVLTTIILWIVFLPSWLTSGSAQRKTLMVSVAIILNGIINLVGMYFPKVFALYFVDESRHTSGGKPRFALASASTVATGVSTQNGMESSQDAKIH